MLITKEFLIKYPNHIFVFGDNTIRKGTGGAAKLRYLPNTYGFITKKLPNNQPSSFYTQEEYADVFVNETVKLIERISSNPHQVFLISRLGGGLANKHGIHEAIIAPGLEILKAFGNVKFLYEE